MLFVTSCLLPFHFLFLSFSTYLNTYVLKHIALFPIRMCDGSDKYQWLIWVCISIYLVCTWKSRKTMYCASLVHDFETFRMLSFQNKIASDNGSLRSNCVALTTCHVWHFIRQLFWVKGKVPLKKLTISKCTFLHILKIQVI